MGQIVSQLVRQSIEAGLTVLPLAWLIGWLGTQSAGSAKVPGAAVWRLLAGSWVLAFLLCQAIGYLSGSWPFTWLCATVGCVGLVGTRLAALRNITPA